MFRLLRFQKHDKLELKRFSWNIYCIYCLLNCCFTNYFFSPWSLFFSLQKIEAHFDARSIAAVEMVIDGAAGQQLPHKTPPRIPPKPKSRSPTPPSIAAKAQLARQQSPSPIRHSPSPVRHVRAPTPSPVRYSFLKEIRSLCVLKLGLIW